MRKVQTKDKSFFLDIKYSDEYNWKGIIKWIDGKKTSTFKNTNELIEIIETVVKQ